jgi:ATP-dependent RNA helicase DeaD
VWFRVNVGRENHADPRWLVPMICRRGRIAKEAIGRIEIRSGETRFEIAPRAAARFESWARRPDRKDPHLRFEPLGPRA